VDGYLSSLKPFEKRNFGTIANWHVERVVSHLDVRLRVETDTLNELLDDLGIKITVKESILS
jgi:hypothetical protein